MADLFSRSYSGPHDFQAMLDLISNARPQAWMFDFPGVADMQELYASPDLQAATRLWWDGPRLAAFAFVMEPYHNLYFEIRQDAWCAALEDEIIQWATGCLREINPDPPEPLTLDTTSRNEDIRRVAMISRHGFVPQPEYTLHFQRDLTLPIPEPQLPAGFSIRPLVGEAEVEALVALHRAAFGTENMTVKERLIIMHAPEFIPELDLVVVSPDGHLAAYCTCGIPVEANAQTGSHNGSTDPVAVHPDFQKLGLARAMLLYGMKLLKERGLLIATLGTSSENIGMQKAARSVGFEVESSFCWYSKAL